MSKNKKVLILANMDITLLYFRQELIDKLILENYDVYVSFPKSCNVKIFEDKGCSFIDVQMDRHGINPFKDIKIIFRYLKILREIKPDYVLTYTIKPNIYGGIASRITKVPQIANITGLGTAMENKGILQKIAILLHKISLKKVKCCFVQNSDNLEFLEKHKIAQNKLKLIPGSGVNLEKYRLLTYPKEDAPIEFLFISRIMKEKGIDQYLEMAEHIKNKYPNTEFHILGFCEQEYEQKLQELQEKKIIKFHGRQDNIIPFLENASCIIHPTYYPEGMSNVLLEACASGRPIITTNRAGCREIIDDGVNGYIVNEKDTNDLIEKVEKFINLSEEERKQMGLAGRKKVEKEFDRQIVVSEYMNQIDSSKEKIIKVLQVFGTLNRGGAETMLMNIYRNIDKEKIHFDFIKHSEEIGAYEEEISSMGGKIYSIPKYKVYNHFKYKKAWKDFFINHPDYKIVHGHVRSTASIYLKIAKKYGIKTIAHSHNISSGKGVKAFIKNVLQFKIRYVADCFMGCSKEANEWLFGKKIANSDRCIILNNAIDFEKFKFSEQRRNDIRKNNNIDDSEIIFGNVGRFVRQKNHRFLIDIFYEYNQNINNKSKLLLIGDGEEKEKIVRKIKKLKLDNNVIIIPTQENIQDYYSAMDLFLFPSLYEGLGIVLIEAQIAKLKVVASNATPKSTCISNYIRYYSLNEKSKYWANECEKFVNENNEYKIDLKNIAKYDIKKQIKVIERFYLNI